MSINKRRQKKKLDRAVNVRNKLLKNRQKSLEERKLEERELMKEEQAEFLVYGKPEPIVERPDSVERKKAVDKRKAQIGKEKIEANLKILNELEKEIKEAEERRNALNKKLEEEGNFTIKEKMDALQNKAIETLEQSKQ